MVGGMTNPAGAPGPTRLIDRVRDALRALGHRVDSLVDMGGDSLHLDGGDCYVVAFGGDLIEEAGTWIVLVYPDEGAALDGLDLLVERRVAAPTGRDADPAAVAAALSPAVGVALAAATLPDGAMLLEPDALEAALRDGDHPEARAGGDVDAELLAVVRSGEIVAARLADGRIAFTRAPLPVGS